MSNSNSRRRKAKKRGLWRDWVPVSQLVPALPDTIKAWSMAMSRAAETPSPRWLEHGLDGVLLVDRGDGEGFTDRPLQPGEDARALLHRQTMTREQCERMFPAFHFKPMSEEVQEAVQDAWAEYLGSGEAWLRTDARGFVVHVPAKERTMFEQLRDPGVLDLSECRDALMRGEVGRFDGLLIKSSPPCVPFWKPRKG